MAPSESIVRMTDMSAIRPTVLSGTDRALGLVSGILNAAGAIWTVALMILVNLDVFLRAAFTAPLSGVPEFVALSITGIVFLQIGSALRADRFIKSDALGALLRKRFPRFGRVIQAAFNGIGCLLFGCIAWATVPIFRKAVDQGTFVGAVGDITFPVWPISLLVIVGSTVVALEYLLFALKAWGDRP